MTEKQETLDGNHLDPMRLALARRIDIPYERASADFKSAWDWYREEPPFDEMDDDEYLGYVDLALVFPDEIPAKALAAFEPISPDDAWTHTTRPRAVEGVDGDMYFYGVLDEDADTYTSEGWVDEHGYTYDQDMLETVYDDGFYQPADPDMEGKLIHRETWDEYANTLVGVFPTGEKLKISFQDGVFMDHADYDPELTTIQDTPAHDAILNIVGGTHWVSTDAWRGYESTPSKPDGYVQAGGSWHSTMTRTSLSDAINDITAQEVVLSFPVLVAFTRTSNLMSTGLDVYVPAEHKEELRAEFEGASAGLDGGRF